MVERTVKGVDRTFRVRYMHGTIASEAICVERRDEVVATAGKGAFLTFGDLNLLSGRKVEGMATTRWVLKNEVLVDLTLDVSAVRKLFGLIDVIRAEQWYSVRP